MSRRVSRYHRAPGFGIGLWMDASMNVKRNAAAAATYLAATIVIATAPAAWAQASAKPDNKGDKIMTRDELRACMKRGDELKAAGDELERDRKVLDGEKADVAKQREVLDQRMKAVAAERETVDKSDEAAVKAYNDKANETIAYVNTRNTEIDAQANALNGRSRAFNERVLAHQQATKDKDTACASRRFREDDEKAIRAGK